MDSTLRLDSSIVSRHRIYSLSVPSGALPLFSHTECHLMTLTPEVHILLYQTLGLTLYSCLYFSGSTLRLDSSIVSRHRVYSLSVPSGALPLFSHTECHLMTLTPEVHILLYQTLGLTLYSCLYFSGSTLRLDSSIVSRHRVYSLSVPSGALPLFSHTECHLITLTPEVHILLYQTLGLTLYSCLYFRSTLQLLRYAPFLQDFVIMNFQFFRCTLLNHDSLNSSNK